MDLNSLQPLMRMYCKNLLSYMQEGVREIVLNRPQEVGVEDIKGNWEFFQDSTLSLSYLETMARYMAQASGQYYDSDRFPLLSFQLPGGHRVQIVSGACTPGRFAMVIRLNRHINFRVGDYNFIDSGSDFLPGNEISDYSTEQLIRAVKAGKTILISGGTGTGKTSFLNALLREIPIEERIVTIEGVPELQVPHHNWCSLCYSENQSSLSKAGARELLNVSLRMRPDRIVLGEIRQENAFVFIRAINTGHKGVLATIHANSPEEAIHALVDNIVLNGDIEGASGSVDALRRRLTQDIFAVVQLERKQHAIRAYVAPIHEEREYASL